MRVTLPLIFLSVISFSAISQVKFASLNTENLFERLPLTCKNEIRSQVSYNPLPNDLSVLCHGVSDILQLHIISTHNGIQHLGFSLFNDSLSKIYPEEICMFLESTILGSALTDRESFIKFLSESNVTIKYGMFENTSNYTLLKDYLDYNNTLTNFILVYDSMKYKATWSEGLTQLSICFPAKNTLLTGMDKKELDELLFNYLENLKFNKTLSASKYSETNYSDLIKYSGNIYLLPGNSYFENISSDLFFLKSVDSMKYNLLFDKKYFAESFTNLLLKPEKVGKNITVNLHHKQYGGITNDVVVDYTDLVTYFSGCKYEAFVGIEDKDSDNLTATVIFFNRSVNNLHLLYVKTKIGSVFADEITFDAKLYSNIPTDNIKNIFADYTDLDFQHELKLK